MADTVTYSSDLRFEALFVDGDTRTFSVKNPKATIRDSDIVRLNAYMQENNILIGDKYGSRFGRIKEAATINRTTVNLDLEQS
ncbi:MAG: hypothetical protein IJP68_07240 [Selenomonadaceae bacterium]|nr:hypothetical protein [Selenomonadaceae bacterium]MBR0061261.1 hypothetical protein [Selenomonadaceae bacterium]